RQTFARVQVTFKEQSPVLLGNSDRQVLGAATLPQRSSIAVLEVHGDQVTLAAGSSGLISIGTRLAVLPAERLPALTHLATLTQVEVPSVQATSARARIVAGTDAGQPPITLGSQAVLVAQPATTRRDVRWIASNQPSPAELAAKAALEREISADTSNLIGIAD